LMIMIMIMIMVYTDLIHMAQIPLDSTRHIRRVEPMDFGCVELVEEHSLDTSSSTGSTRRARQALLAT